MMPARKFFEKCALVSENTGRERGVRRQSDKSCQSGLGCPISGAVAESEATWFRCHDSVLDCKRGCCFRSH